MAGRGSAWDNASNEGLHSQSDVIVTVRVSGLPPHVTESEFNCWFLFAPGFEQATLAPNRQPGQPQAGWARFSTTETAQTALDYLNGLQLTPDMSPGCDTVLKAEPAKNNFKPRVSTPKQPAPLQAAMPGLRASPPAQWSGSAIQVQGSPNSGATGDSSGTTPCSTLFVWKLQASATEEELVAICFEACPGFERLKFVPCSEGRGGRCFIKFISELHAANALQVLREVALPSNPTSEALQVDYARAELDQPKNAMPPAHQPQQQQPLMLSPHLQRQPLLLQPQLPQRQPQQLQQDVMGRQAVGSFAPAQETRGNAPCDTMWMGNLGTLFLEAELSAVMSTVRGYERMKFIGEGTDKAMAFVQFDCVQSCSAAISALHLSTLPIAPSVVLNCRFSKNSLGKTARFS